MDPYLEEQQRQQAKRRQEQLEKRAERDLPYDIAKYQHELARTLLQEQHQLNLEIHNKQAQLTKFSTYATIISTIFASLLGVGLGFYLSTKSEPQYRLPMKLEPILELNKYVPQKVEQETSVHRKEINESLQQAAIVLKNVSSANPVKK